MGRRKEKKTINDAGFNLSDDQNVIVISSEAYEVMGKFIAVDTKYGITVDECSDCDFNLEADCVFKYAPCTVHERADSRDVIFKKVVLSETVLNKMKLSIGDASGDGHRQSRDVVYLVNKTVKEVQDAYKASCKLTGYQFNHNENYTGRRKLTRFSKICTDYEDSSMDQEIYEVFTEDYGMPDTFTTLNSNYRAVTDFEGLWWWFVSLSLPEVEYTVVEEEKIAVINTGKLNVQFGYGLFY